MSALALLRANTSYRGPSLDFSNLMAADVGPLVLRHLASTQDRVRICRSVSQECRQLVDSQVQRLRANLKAISTHNEALVLPLHFPRLESLSFDRAAASESSELLLQLAQHQPQLLAHLQELDLSSCQGLEADALSALLQASSSLRSLTLPCLSATVSSSKQDFMRVISVHGQQLQHLNCFGDYVDADTLPLVAQLTALQTLDLVTERYALPIAPRSLQPLAALSHLHSLHLGNHLACYDVFELAAAMPALQELMFSYVRESAVSAQDLAPLRHSRTLQQLALAGIDCSDDVLDVLAAAPVTDLSFQAAGFCATPKGVGRMAGRLQSLHVEVRDTTCTAVAAALPALGQGLTSLSLQVHRASVGYSGLLQAVFGLPALQQLSLGCHYKGFSESEVQDLPVATHLMQLSLSNHFSDVTLGCILGSTPGLKHLSLSSCGEVGSEGLGCVLGHCSRLRSVRLELMRGATAAGVAALAGGTCMQSIVLEGCRNVTADDCRELTRKLNRPDLDIIKLR